jgi:hypothetical protein
MVVTINIILLPNSMNEMDITMSLVLCETGTDSLYGAYNSEEVYPSIHAWRSSSFWALASLKERLHSSVSRARSSILVFPESALHPSEKRASILFLVFY